MKTILAKAPLEFEYRELPVPQPAAGEVLIRMKACGICATDFHNAKHKYSSFTPIGHEGSGEVAALGPGVAVLRVGDKVAVSGGAPCGTCACCQQGQARLCRSGPSVWNDKHMLLSEYAVVDQRMLHAFTKLDWQAAALLEPSCVAMELVRESQLEAGEPALIVGLGAIGLMAAQIAGFMDAQVYGAELSTAESHLAAARKLNIKAIVTDQESIARLCAEKKIRRIMVTAPPTVLPDAVAAIEFGGLIAYIGLGFGGREIVAFNTNVLLRKKGTLKAVYAVPTLYAKETMRLLESGAIAAEPIISHTFGFDDIRNAFRTIDETKRAIKVMVTL